MTSKTPIRWSQRLAACTFLFLLISTCAFSQYTVYDKVTLLNRLQTEDVEGRIQTLYELCKSQEFSDAERIVFARRGLALALRVGLQKEIVRGYYALSFALVGSMKNIDSCTYFADKSYELASRLNLTVEMAEVRLIQGYIEGLKDNRTLALEIDEDAARLAELSGDSTTISRAYHRLSTLYLDVGLDSTAFSYVHRAFDFANQRRDEIGYATLQNQLGHCYSAIGEYKKALDLYYQFSNVAKKYKLFMHRGFCHLNIANNYKQLGEIEKVAEVTYENIAFARTHHLINIEASALAFVAEWLARQHQYDSAIACLTAANKIWTSLKFSGASYYVRNEIQIGINLIKSGRVTTGITMLQACYEISKKNRQYENIKISLSALSDVFISQNNYRQAHYYLAELIKNNDSLQSQKTLDEMARLEYRFTLAKAGREKQLISIENDANKLLIQQKNVTQLILISTLAILIIAILFIARLYRQKTRANTELTTSYATIAQQKEELRASLENSIRMQEQLMNAEKMASLGQLTAGIAHEINNPLNFINGGVSALIDLHNDALELLKVATPSNERVEQLAHELQSMTSVIQNGVNRSTTIIKNLRTFSSPVESISNDSRTYLQKSIEGALSLLASKIKDARVTITTEADPTLVAHANESLIQQVILNIIDNAVQALEEKSGNRAIYIFTQEQDGTVSIHIRDNGPGIPAEYQRHIMDPFFTTKEVGKGTGLGLYISYGIIQKHGGKLTFTSSSEGTEFMISLPRVNES